MEQITILYADNLIEFMHSYHDWMAAIFWLINFLAVLSFFPLTLFWIAAGLLFGPVTGTLLTTTAATASAGAAFLLSRKYETRFSRQLDKHHKAQMLKKKLERRIAQNNFSVIFIIRMLPHPYILLSYIAGLINTIRFKQYILATLSAISILSFCFVSFGDSLMKGPQALIIPALSILVVTQLAKLASTLDKRRKQLD